MYSEETIRSLLADYDSGHTQFQIENFIVGTEIHPWHKYIQCLREIAGRADALFDARETLALLKIELENLNAKKWFVSNKQKVKIKRQEKKIENIESGIEKNETELAEFIRIALEIKAGFNGDLTPEKKKFLEAEAWREKAKYMLCMDLFCIGRPSKQTIEFIYKLPRETKRELLMSIDPLNQQAILDYLIS